MVEVLQKLPQDICNKIFYFYAEHPTAVLIKDRFLHCDSCKRNLKENKHIVCGLCDNVFCHRCTPYDKYCGDEGDMLICLKCMVFRYEKCWELHQSDGYFKRGLYDDVTNEIIRFFADDENDVNDYSFLEDLTDPDNNHVLTLIYRSFFILNKNGLIS